MARRDVLKERYEKVLRWQTEFQAAQATVLAETGVWVPFNRMVAHCHLETGGSGDPKSISGRNNQLCSKPGKDCAADGKAHGLFQIYWPPFGGVEWNRIYDPGYNSYLGAKVLAYRFQEFGRNWENASRAFFAPVCVLTNEVVDPNTGVDCNEYAEGIRQRIQELEELGIGVGDSSENPKVPPTNGSTNTSDDKPNNPLEFCIPLPLGQEYCIDFIPMVRTWFEENFPKIAFVALGIVLLAIGVYTTVM